MKHAPTPSRLNRASGVVICAASLGVTVAPRDARAQPQVVDQVVVNEREYAPPAQVTPAAAETAAVRQVVDDYVGLYRKDTLAEWRKLFLPTFTCTSTNEDGTVTVRTLDQFFESQARGFAEATEMSETLEHVAIERTGRLATAWADFVFRHDGTARRGRLVLTLVEADANWRIASLMFSY